MDPVKSSSPKNPTANVYRNLFPYTEVPRIAFNDRIVPHCMPVEIWITEDGKTEEWLAILTPTHSPMQ